MEAKATAVTDDTSMSSDTASADELAKAEEYKSKGNDFFKCKPIANFYLCVLDGLASIFD